MKEVRKGCPSARLFLVGLKKDMRETGIKTVTVDEARAMAERIGAELYVECSAKLQQGVTDVFDTVAKAMLTTPERKRNCTML